MQKDLHAALKQMMQSIDTGATESIASQVMRIDEIGRAMGGDAPPMLRHYLDKRSYAKALDFLEGRDETAAPNC